MSKKTFNIDGKKISISNPEKMFYPEEGYKKKDILDYYLKISSIMLAHLKERPLNMHRAPDGVEGETFYQQDISDYFPEWVGRIETERKGGGKITHAVCNDKKTLLYLAGQAVLTMHIWLSRTDSINEPDKMIFDLDPPPDSGFKAVKEGALKLNEYFNSLSVPSYVMTTGSKGLHVLIPLIPQYPFDKVRKKARQIAEEAAASFSDIFTIEQLKDKRGGKMFLDYLRNSYGQTSVCPYSLRILPHAPVAAPLDWQELKNPALHSQSYHLGNIFKRLGQKKDIWKDMHKYGVSLQKLN